MNVDTLLCRCIVCVCVCVWHPHPKVVFSIMCIILFTGGPMHHGPGHGLDPCAKEQNKNDWIPPLPSNASWDRTSTRSPTLPPNALKIFSVEMPTENVISIKVLRAIIEFQFLCKISDIVPGTAHDGECRGGYPWTGPRIPPSLSPLPFPSLPLTWSLIRGTLPFPPERTRDQRIPPPLPGGRTWAVTVW